MTYATVKDVQDRMTRTLSQAETKLCRALLEDASAIIDASAAGAPVPAKKTVCCRMVARVLGDGDGYGVPQGASQGSMSALGYSQSWTFGNGGGAAGELYLSKVERRILGIGNSIGSRSPVEDIAAQPPKGGCCRD